MRVLVVDDERSSLRAVTALLEGDGIDTLGLLDGSAAVEAIGREHFDAVVTDLEMPGADGAEIIRAARARLPRAAIIVVTGSASGDDPRAAGAHRRLNKPVDYCELVEALNELTGHAHEESRTFRQLVENIREVFWMTTPEKDQILYVSPGYEEIWGRSRKSLYHEPRSWLDAIHPDDRAMVDAAAATQSLERYDATYRIVRPDGTTRWVRDRSFTVRGAGGAVERIVGIAEDATELRSTEEQLRQAQKMEAIGRLAGGVAHDFNNLLSVILSYADLVAGELGAGHPLGGDLEEIHSAALRATALTRQLLMFSRQEISQPRVVDLATTLQNLEKMLRRIVVENIEVVALPGSRGSIKIDPGQIDQVIMNLVVNARDAMPDGGRVTISTRDVVIDDAFAREHVGIMPGPYVMLAVEDTGIGMDRATKARIFEPFFTTKEAGKGTGLGLSTVFGIVKQGGGYISVDSDPGKGTTFRIYLPRVDNAGTPDAQGTTGKGAPRKGSETILLVEDNEQVRAVATTILRRGGYRVLDARSVQDARRLFAEHGPSIDLLVTDVIMPDTSGPELAASLRAERADLKVLLVSGYAGEAFARHESVAASLPLLGKPFTPEALTRKVREVLDPTRPTSAR